MITGSVVLTNVFKSMFAKVHTKTGAFGFPILLLLFVSGILGCSAESGTDAKLPEKPELRLSDNSVIPVQELSERWLLMNYWASWCAPCIEEIPELSKLNQRDSFKVVLYNFDQLRGEDLMAEAAKLNIDLPMMLNEPAPLFALDSPSALPATLVIDRKTGAQQWLMGAQTESGILQKLGDNG